MKGAEELMDGLYYYFHVITINDQYYEYFKNSVANAR